MCVSTSFQLAWRNEELPVLIIWWANLSLCSSPHHTHMRAHLNSRDVHETEKHHQQRNSFSLTHTQIFLADGLDTFALAVWHLCTDRFLNTSEIRLNLYFTLSFVARSFIYTQTFRGENASSASSTFCCWSTLTIPSGFIATHTHTHSCGSCLHKTRLGPSPAAGINQAGPSRSLSNQANPDAGESKARGTAAESEII